MAAFIFSPVNSLVRDHAHGQGPSKLTTLSCSHGLQVHKAGGSSCSRSRRVPKKQELSWTCSSLFPEILSSSRSFSLVTQGASGAFRPVAEASGTSSATEASEQEVFDTKKFKRSLQASDNYHRKGFGHKEEVAEMMETEYQSDLVQTIRDNDYTISRGDVTIRLAKSFGYCWGVERAVAMAYETRKQFPTQTIWITNEIIHNPFVNQQLRDMGVKFVPVVDSAKDFSEIDSGDVVILPAFGASVQEMQLLNDRGCVIVDTTCPWVSKVWNSVEKHKKATHTSIIHGKYAHEETIATASFAGTYLIVLNVDEAEYVANYILNGGERDEFLAKFANATSKGFDPEKDLERVGVANQTTMLKGETEEIGKLFEKTMMRKFGPESLNNHFMSFNTICDATQERQDAMAELVQDKVDVMIVIGGYNSSNTTHLQEMAIHNGIPSFHIDSADRLFPNNAIEHQPLFAKELAVTDNWLPAGPVVVGVTSGASTPDKTVAEVITKIFEQRAVPVHAVA